MSRATATRAFHRVLVSLSLSFLLLGATNRPARAQEASPPVERSTLLEWDTDRRLLYLGIAFRDLIDAGIQRKLSRGFPTTIVLTATVQRGGSNEVLSTTTQTCRVTWDVWEEAYHIEIVRPGSSQVRWTPTLEGVLRRCAEARRLLAGDAGQVPIDVPLYVRGSIQVNPVSPEVLKKLRRWVMRPSSTGTAAPGDALFSTFTGIFLQRIGEAERDQKFFTRPTQPAKFSSKQEEREMTPTFPVALRLEGRACLVVGTGEEARARAVALEAAGAIVSVRATFEPADLEGAWLAVLTERDADLAERVAAEAEKRRVFFCAVDQPDAGSYSHLAIARAGLVFAALGTQGEVPALARRLRELVEALFERAGLEEFAERLAELRRGTPPEQRRSVLNRAVEGVRLEGALVLPKTNDPKE